MSWFPRMKILEVVIGSNHFLIQPHTVGKNAGAPIIWELLGLVFNKENGFRRNGKREDPCTGETYENPVEGFGIMCCC